MNQYLNHKYTVKEFMRVIFDMTERYGNKETPNRLLGEDIRLLVKSMKELNSEEVEEVGKQTYSKCYNIKDKEWHLVLNRYQRDNLVSLMNAIGYSVKDKSIKPFIVFNTGDWVGEFTSMLRRIDGSYTIDEKDSPNISREGILESIKYYK